MHLSDIGQIPGTAECALIYDSGDTFMSCVGHVDSVHEHLASDTPRSGTDLYQRIDEDIETLASQVIEWRHHLHSHPELSNREVNTARFIAEHLRSLALDEVRTDIAGHGVIGVLRGGMPGDQVIALRADIDALPVRELVDVAFASTVVDSNYPGGPFPVAHACGHDCHTAMLMGAASALAGVRDQLAGTVLFVFQPAEEGAPLGEEGGAAAMDDAGALADPMPTMVFGMHVAPLPKGIVAYRIGNQYAASVVVRIVITGQQVHGSTPWMGKDPMPVAAEIIMASAQLYRQVPAFNPVTISFGHVEDQGRFNIIGEAVTLMGTVRCSVESDMKAICQRMEQLASHIAQAQGCAAKTEFLQHVPAVHNEAKWVQACIPTLEAVVGHANLVQTPPTLGYDDVSVFVNRYGGLYVLLGVQDAQFKDGAIAPTPGGRGISYNHNPHFYADDGTLQTGVRLHAHIAIDHLMGILKVE
jgi:amidohydrolase